MKRVYLDHAAATPVDPRVTEAMAPFAASEFGNPSAIHAEGVAARSALLAARTSIAGVLGVLPETLTFTGSATESLNLAIFGTVAAWKDAHPGRTPHIIMSSIEHDAVLLPGVMLEKQGAHVARMPVLASGIIDTAKLEGMLTEDTVIISLMYANNEIGTVLPIREVAKIVRHWKKEQREAVRSHKATGDELYPLLHTDAVQAANYLELNVPKLGVDLLTISAAKIYGPKGVALLYKGSGILLSPTIVGGGHEAGMRAGTENVPGIVGFAKALEIAEEMKENESVRLRHLQAMLMTELTSIPGLMINGDQEMRLPNNVHFSLPEVDHEYLTILLDARGFAVATKSACNEEDAETSHVLLAMNVTGEKPTSGIRVSMGRATTQEDIKSFVKTLKDIAAEGLLTQP